MCIRFKQAAKSSSLGIVPRQCSSGGKSVLRGMSKRGNRYIRTLLIHGARSVFRTCHNKEDKLSLWCQNLIKRRGFNVAAVALANKNALILWALARKEECYQPPVVLNDFQGRVIHPYRLTAEQNKIAEVIFPIDDTNRSDRCF